MKPRAHIARSRVSVELSAIGAQGMQPFLGTIVIVSSHHQTIPNPSQTSYYGFDDRTFNLVGFQRRE